VAYARYLNRRMSATTSDNTSDNSTEMTSDDASGMYTRVFGRSMRMSPGSRPNQEKPARALPALSGRAVRARIARSPPTGGQAAFNDRHSEAAGGDQQKPDGE
jgi:hypothetical protein